MVVEELSLTDATLRAAQLGTSLLAGSTRWMAPELILSLVEDDDGVPCPVTRESDVFSFACVCLEVCVLLPPVSYFFFSTLVVVVVGSHERPTVPTPPQRPCGDARHFARRPAVSWGAAYTGHALDGAAGGVVLGRVGSVLESDTAVTADDDRGRNNVGCYCRVMHPPAACGSKVEGSMCRVYLSYLSHSSRIGTSRLLTCSRNVHYYTHMNTAPSRRGRSWLVGMHSFSSVLRDLL
jgi:serine/threonine protein kinase